MDLTWLTNPLVFYTAVGSRETPEDMLVLQFHMGRELCDMGVQGHSGLADGSDETYYEGAKQSKRFDEIGFTNFIPWNGFASSAKSLNKHFADPNKLIFNLDESPFRRRAWCLGVGARGGDMGLIKCDSLSRIRGGHSLHARNAHQVLGLWLNKKSSFVHCWAKPVGKSDRVQGGTATAVALAHHFKIRVINLATPEGLAWTLNFLKNRNVEIDYSKYETKEAP